MRTIDDLKAADTFVKKGTLVLCDIDDTLAITASDYGSQKWLDANTPKKEDVGEEEYQKAFREIRNKKNQEIEPYLKYQLIQPDALEILKSWKERGANFMCLTARNPISRVVATEMLLSTLGIFHYLSHTTLSLDFELKQPVKVKNGIIYGNNFNPKYEVFLEVKRLLSLEYSNLVFFEDSEKHALDFAKNISEATVFLYTCKETFTIAYSEEIVAFQKAELTRTKELGSPIVPTNFEARAELNKKLQPASNNKE